MIIAVKVRAKLLKIMHTKKLLPHCTWQEFQGVNCGATLVAL